VTVVARSWVVTLIVVEAFNFLSAFGGGIALVVSNGLGMPLSLLESSPFGSFIGPGCILGVVVGGANGAAMMLAVLDRPVALAAGAVAAFAMIVWIYVEVSMLLFYHWLQTVYFASGVTQLALVLVLLGVLHCRRRGSPHHDCFEEDQEHFRSNRRPGEGKARRGHRRRAVAQRRQGRSGQGADEDDR
jgi:hypothetical protein